jgi:hypothetical protein
MHAKRGFAALISIALTFGFAGSGQAQSQRKPLQAVDPWQPGISLQSARHGVTRNIALSATNWTFLGPAPQNSGGANGNVGGRITGIAGDPNNANTIYIATAGGGVWKTTDGGTNWTPLTDPFPSLSMGSIAVARSNASVIYAGTGESNNAIDSNYGRGILVSTNGGASWTLRTGPLAVFSRRAIGRIAIDPTNPNIAYAAVGGFATNGLFGSTGIYKTTNGGVTWTNVTGANGLDQNTTWSDVVVDGTTPTTVYAAHGDIFGDANNGVYRSTDGGTNWNLLNNAPNGANTGRIAIALSRSNSQVLYVAVTTRIQNPGTAADGKSQAVARSTDGGNNFTTLNPPNYMGGNGTTAGQGWYDTTVAVDPVNSAIVYVAGSAGTNSILRSTDSGANWTDISGGGVSPHADHHAAEFDAAGVFLDGDDGGIYRLTNAAGPTWADINGNLGALQFEGIGLHPTNANIAIGGTQDNGVGVYSNSLTWTETDGGDGGFSKFSQTNGNIAYHQIPVASFGANFFRFSSNGGSTWTTRTAGIVADQGVQNFYAPFVVDPGNGDRVLYGTNRVWETTNEGVTWTAFASPGVNGWNPASNNVSAIGLAPSDANTIYAATGSQLFVSTDHGANWTQRNTGLSGSIQDIQVNPTNAAVAYVASNSFNSKRNVFRTTNTGVNWTNISGSLPDEPVFSLQLDPPNNIVYAGAERGVFFTNDNGAHWTKLGNGLPVAEVFQIEWNNALKILGAGTHGRGLWELSIPTPPIPTIEVKGNGSIAVTGGRATFSLDVITPVPPNTVHTVSYSDRVHNFSINMTNVTSATLAGNHCHIVGTAKVNNTGPSVTITVDTFDNPDQFFISSSTGYSAGGNLTSGSIVDE